MQSHSYYLHRLPNLPSKNARSSLARSSLRSSDSFLRLRTSEFSISSKLPPFAAQSVSHLRAFDEDSFGGPLYDDWGEGELPTGYFYSSSDEDNEPEILLTPLSDVDLPSYSAQNNDALTVTAHRFAMLGRGLRKHRSKRGTLISFGLILFVMFLLIYIDWCAWRIVRLPLEPFFLTRPFFISGVLASCAGYVCIPFLRALKIYQVVTKEGRHIGQSVKTRTPIMGGLFFIPIGVAVARFTAGSSSVEVAGAVVATLAFAAIGLLDDILSIMKNHNYGLPAWSKIILEGAVGACFSCWLEKTSICSPYGMKSIIPLPVGLLCLGCCYQYLTSLCFVSMGNGVNLTDGLDGLAGGTAALVFIGMSIAVLPLCPGLATFGASMAGSCLGFLVHNRYKASILMGETGSLALGGGLAAMAACTGMFLPLFISSGIFVVETSSVVLQVLYSKITNRSKGRGRRLFRMAPFHLHLELIGLEVPTIVAGAYVISSALALFAGYVALISV